MNKPFLPALRAALVDRRTSADVSQTAVGLVGGFDRSNISRFERGEAGWPEDPDIYVDAYAKACGVGAAEIWADAARRYLRHRRRSA